MKWLNFACSVSIGKAHFDLGGADRKFATTQVEQARRAMELVCGQIGQAPPGLHRGKYAKYKEARGYINQRTRADFNACNISFIATKMFFLFNSLPKCFYYWISVYSEWLYAYNLFNPLHPQSHTPPCVVCHIYICKEINFFLVYWADVL